MKTLVPLFFDSHCIYPCLLLIESERLPSVCSKVTSCLSVGTAMLDPCTMYSVQLVYIEESCTLYNQCIYIYRGSFMVYIQYIQRIPARYRQYILEDRGSHCTLYSQYIENRGSLCTITLYSQYIEYQCSIRCPLSIGQLLKIHAMYNASSILKFQFKNIGYN